MKKQRIVSILLAFVLLVPVFANAVVCGLALYAENNDPFSYYDKRRDAILDGKTPTPLSFSPSAGGDAYIVAFEKDTDRNAVYNAVRDYEFSLPAYSSELVFVVNISDIDAFYRKNSSLLRYVIPDEAVAGCAEFHAEYAENALIGASADVTSGGSGAVVAVLDSGIDRANEAFALSDILEGWDCVNDKAGVDGDSEGHGTRVSAIIVSSETGIARGASLLPVKITDDAHKIMTSDLVEGLYYAADYGADVINMSFGGYYENIAEKEAVAYAASKGCILVASAGNEGGDPELAGKRSYPASFEQVISVASVNASGKVSAFSQFNDMVDIASPGEMLHLLGKDETSPSEELSGTSYATAYVSAAAALAVSQSQRKLGHDGFEKLLEYASDVQKNDSTGYGVLNIPRLLESLNKPTVSGVSNGKVYFEEVRAYFENASALLDGEEYESGDPIFSQGSHTLVVTDELGSVTIKFDVDTVPLTYEIEYGEKWAAITFTTGSATLDGEEYISGTRITGHGSHKFVLTGKYGNSVSETIFISYDLPSVYGVSDGGVYDRGIYITTTGGGHTYLDGTEFFGGVFVGKKGDYVLRVTDDGALLEKTIRFSLSRDAGDAVSKAPYSRMTHTGTDGLIAFWDNGEKQFSVCNEDDLSTQKVVETESAIVTIGAYDGRLCVVTTDGWYFYDAASPELPVGSHVIEEGNAIVSASYHDGKMVYVDLSGSAVFTDGVETSEKYVGGMNTIIEYGDGEFYLYSAMNPLVVTIFDGEWSEKQLPNYPMMFRIKAGDGVVCVGSTVYGTSVSETLCELTDTSRVLWCGDGIVITSDKLCLTDGNVVGVYPNELSYVCRNGEKTYFICSDGGFSYTDDTVNYGSFASEDTITGSMQNVRAFEYVIPIVSGKTVKDACFDRQSGNLAVICANDNRLYYIDPESGSNVGSVILRYAPSSLRELENGTAVVFMNSPSVYLTQTGGYMTFPSRVSDVCVSDGRIFAVCGSRLCEYTPDGGTVYLLEDMTVDAIVGGKGRLFVSSDYDLYSYDVSDMSENGNTELFFRGRLAISDDYVYAGNGIYSAEDLSDVSTTDGNVLAVRGYSAVTDTGLYSVREGKTVSSRTYGDIAVITDGFDTFFFGKDSISVIRSDGDMCGDVIIEGVSDGASYDNEVTFSVSRGTVYLDGVHCENTFTAAGNGRHVLKVNLPWGMTRELTFTVVTHPETLSVTEEINIASGRRVKLNPRVTPENADVKYTFRVVSGDSASVDAKGYVTALAEGSTVIEVGVEGTELKAAVTVNVSDIAINCTDGRYVIDRENELICGVEAGTDVSDFLGSFEGFENTHVVTLPDGTPVNEGIICTGMKLNKYTTSGALTDSLTVTVKGDLDGDGRNTLNDARILYENLKTSRYTDDAVRKAADVNLNGNITVSDFKTLRSLIENDSVTEESGDHGHVTCPAFVYKGSTFYVTFRNDGITGASAVSGEFTYDATAFELVKTEYYYGEIYTENKDGVVKYSAYGIDRVQSGTRLFRMYFYVKPTAKPGRTTIGLTNTVVSRGKAYRAVDRFTTPLIKNDAKDVLTVSAIDSDLDFREGVTEYDVTIPLTSEKLDLTVDCPAHHYVYYSEDIIVPEDGSVRMVLEYVTPTKVVDYVFNVRRGIIRTPESDPSLHSVSVFNGRLKTPFSPEKTSYTVIPEGEVTYSAVPAGSRSSVEYVYSDDGKNCTVKCTAENGSVREYVFTLEEPEPEVSEDESKEPESSEESEPVSEESVPEEPSESEESAYESSAASEESSETEEKSSKAPLIIAAASVFVIACAVIAVILVRRKKKK